jgi:hypothetical protein
MRSSLLVFLAHTPIARPSWPRPGKEERSRPANHKKRSIYSIETINFLVADLEKIEPTAS